MKKNICFIVSAPGTAISFLSNHILALKKEYDVYVVANYKDINEVSSLNANGYKHVGICRQISIFNDLKAVCNLFCYFRQMKFDSVHSVTPKAGLITALASFFARVPIRIHIFTGQVWATQHGIKRWILMFMDKLIAKLDNSILVDGKSQRQFLIQHKIISLKNSHVFGEGSICGVDTKKFEPNSEIRLSERKKLGIDDDTVVYIFMGRLNHDKGIEELILAYNRLFQNYTNTKLLLLGNEENNYISKLTAKGIKTDNPNIIYYGHTSTPAKTTQAGDIFCLPTYREGFPTSVIEASCLGLPVICSNAYGVMDTMIEGKTGLRCNVGDIDSLYSCMERLYEDKSLRIFLGQQGRQRVLQHFSGEVITQHWMDFYHNLFYNK